MTKGTKMERGYATVKDLGGMDYRSISIHMTESGHKMNHATARNIFLRAMSKVARCMCELNGSELSREQLKSLAIDPVFQSAVCEIIFNLNHADAE